MAKTLLIWRVGGVGDLLWCTAALPVLRRQGFTIDFCTDAGGRAVLENNPHVRRLIKWEDQRDPGGRELHDPETPQQLIPARIAAWFSGLRAGYDAAVPLTWTIEGTYLWRAKDNPAEYWMAQAERQTDANYTDEMVRRLAMPWLGGLLPQLFPTAAERRWLERLVKEHRLRDEQFLLWHLAGSSYNKIIPQAPAYVAGLLEQFPKLVAYLLGDERGLAAVAPARLTEAVRGRARCVMGHWNLRQQMLATSVADCVVGPESAIVNAAACWDTPKVIFFSHSAPHNLSLYWWNAYPILPAAGCECAPCYRLIEGDPEECRAYEAEMPPESMEPEVRERVAADGRGRPAGAKCCLHLDHGRVFQTIGGILLGRQDRTCPACGRQKNRILEEGVYACACGARFGLPTGPQRQPVAPQPMVCPVCRGQVYDRLAVPGAPGWARCACGVVFQDAKHLQAEVYDAGYVAKYDSAELRAKIRAVGERWIPRFEGLLGGPGHLLEIGYCLPENLRLAQGRGWRILGCETNPAVAPDFPFLRGDFEAVELNGHRGRLDAIMSNHVFEHFRDPLAALEKMRDLVRPGGLIFIETPDAEHPALPAHLHRKEHHVMWSPAALAREAMARGLEVLEVERHDGPECGFISWYDFAILLRRPAAAEPVPVPVPEAG